MMISKDILQTIRAALEDTQTRIDHSQAILSNTQRDNATQGILDALNWLYQLPDTPKPDWSSAPDWSNWWTVDPNGYAAWFQEEPILSLTVSFSGWLPQTMSGVQLGNMIWGAEVEIPLGVDWRLLKEERPK